MRVAETRAVNRALRKAYGIGLCSVEELGWEPRPQRAPDPQKATSPVQNTEPVTLIGLTTLWINGRPLVAPTLNSRRASLVLSKIDEILAWEKNSDRDRDTQFVELGRYLCEVRAGQYWRLDNLKSFDEYLEKKFPESRAQGILPNGNSRPSTQDCEDRTQTDGMDKG